MTKSRLMSKRPEQSRLKAMFERADAMWDEGRVPEAFQLFLVAAKSGDRASQLNVGYMYETGKGVRRDKSLALYWYKRAYRSGDSSAAHNIGTFWREQSKPRRALWWFFRAVKLGSDSSYLEIAKYYLQSDLDPKKGVKYLKAVRESKTVSEAEMEEADFLLRKADERLRKC